MTWQDGIVWLFGVVLAAVVVWRLVQTLRGRRVPACGSCSRECPMRNKGKDARCPGESK